MAREWPALEGVGLEQARRGPAQHGGQLPAEVGRVLKAGVHALGANGAVDVRRVAEQEHTPLLEFRGHPVVDVIRREPLDLLDGHAEASLRGLAHVLESQVLTLVQLGREQADQAEAIFRVHREKRSEPLGLERKIQLSGADGAVGAGVRHEEALRVFVTGEVHGDLAADAAVSPVAASRVGDLDFGLTSQHRHHAVGRLAQAGQLRVPFDPGADSLELVREQGFVAMLGQHQDVGVRAHALAHVADGDASDGSPVDPDATLVHQVAFGYGSGTEAELIIDFQRARLDPQRFGLPGDAGLLVHDSHAGSRPPQLQGKHQSCRPRTDHKHVRFHGRCFQVPQGPSPHTPNAPPWLLTPLHSRCLPTSPSFPPRWP